MKLPLYTKNILTAIIFALFSISSAHAALPSCTNLVSPANAAIVNQGSSVTFSWAAVTDAVPTIQGYNFLLSHFANGSDTIMQTGVLSGTATTPVTITQPCGTYYWTAVPKNADGYALGCTYNAITVVAPTEPTLFPTSTWSVSVYSNPDFTGYAGYYTHSNSTPNGYTYLSTNAWSSTFTPAITPANSTPPFTITAYKGCSFANSDNFSFIYKRKFTLTEGVYTCTFKQQVGTGNSLQFLINGTSVLTSAVATPTITIYIPADAELQVKSVAGVGDSYSQVVSIASVTPPALLPGTLITDATICYNTRPANLSTAAATGGCGATATKTYQWQSSADGVTYSDISGATASQYRPLAMTTTTYFKRIVTDICLQTAETTPVLITVGPAPTTVTPGTIGTSTSICSGGSVELTSITDGAGGHLDSTILYQWYTNASGSYVLITDETSATYTTPALTATTSYRRRTVSTSACLPLTSAFTNVVTITVVNALSAPASITGNTTQCVGNTGVVYTAATVTGATAYEWTLPVGVTAVSGATTRIITVDFDESFTGGTLSSAAVNACGVGSIVDTILTVGSCANTWTGATSTAWATTTNWSTGVVPTSTKNVIIPNVTNKPVITGTANANNIVIASGSSLTVSGTGTLRLYGSIANNGTLTTSGTTAKIQTYKASGIQTLAGDLSGIKYLIKATTATLQLANDWTVTGRIDLRAGAINVNGHALIFDVVNGGYIGYTAGDIGTITGNVTVKKTLGQYTHNIASPLGGVTATQISDDFQVINPSNSKSRLYSWNGATQNWSATGLPLSTSLNIGTGYNLYCTTAGELDFTGTYTQSATPLEFTGSAAIGGDVFLFGNPYLADLNWETIGKTNVDATVYYWNQSASTYATYTTGGANTNGGTIRVPVLQGFYISATAGGTAKISVDPNAIFSNAPTTTFYRQAAPSDRFNLIVKDNAGKSDEVVVAVDDDATTDFDGAIDAYKFPNPNTSLNLYTTVGTKDYAVNNIPSSAIDQSIPLSFVAPASGTYTIETTSINLTTVDAFLKDKVTGTITPVNALPYTFTANKTDAAGRFDIMFRTTTTTSTHSAATAAGISFASFQKDLVILNQSLQMSNATIVITDLTGNTVKTITGASISSNATFNLSELASGMYMIKLIDQANGNAYSGKVSIQ